MSTTALVLHLTDLAPGLTRLQGPLAFSVLDAAGESEPHQLDVTAEVENMGTRLYVRGRARGVAQAHCHRCLAQFERPVDSAFELVLQRGAADDANGEIVALADRATEVDLAPHVREAVILDEPIRQVCAPDCKGLCPQCGADRNEVQCACEKPADPRWDALKDLSRRLER